MMNLIEGLTPMGCGGCGTKTVRIYTDGKSLFAQCTKQECGAVAELAVSTPKIELRWTEGSDGVLARQPG